MNLNYYNLLLSIFSLFAVVLVLFKMNAVEEIEDLETNYIGEFQDKDDDVEDTEENKELLEISNKIRVLIKDSGYNNLTHDILEVSSNSGLCIVYETETAYVDSGEVFTIDGVEYDNQMIIISPVDTDGEILVHSLERGYGEPEYAGVLYVYVEEDKLVIVNELELEEYLKGVLPSEMPASYEEEALKAQAVCARSYAYTYMDTYAYEEYEANVDDSTSYQVYNNLQESESCNQAIEETADEKVMIGGEVITTYFFSTSSGNTTDVSAWGREVTEEYEYLTGISVCNADGVDYEEDLSWYAWSILISSDTMERILQENITEDFGSLEAISVMEYGTGDIALKVKIEGSKTNVEIEGEYEIRSALGSTSYMIDRQDGSQVSGSALLPSAFFTLEYKEGNYIITGGGYGHGVGMSQNGANEMAKSGSDYIEILEFFYEGVQIG